MNATQEQWRPVVGYEGAYEVSDHGRVRSLTFTQTHKNGTKRIHQGRILTPDLGRRYPRVNLYRGGIARSGFIHCLVLEAFVGPRPEGAEACHADDDKTNAKLSNLRWDTRSENIHDRRRNGANHQVNKTHCPNGHELSGSNISPWMARRGYRTCRSCAAARAYVQRHPGMNVLTESDRYYLRYAPSRSSDER